MDPQVQKFASEIRDRLPRLAHDIDAAAEDLKRFLSDLVGPPDEAMLANLKEATELVRSEFAEIEILRHHSVIRPRDKWYSGPKVGDRHWPALKQYLTGPKGWEPGTVDSIDETSTEIVSLLENPLKSQYACRGLVVGHVQSGKTANMTAVIAKAVDAGYNVIIVLAGLTDKLRQQTQKRLEQDIVSLHPMLWHRLTTLDIKGDFQLPAHGHLMHHSDRAQLAVTKKNPAPLNKLLTAIQRTPPVELSRLRVLVIDDECDQASVNSASGEFDMTKINELIRRLVSDKLLPAVSYVGYTATPFANVLINPYADKTDDFDDLYPRDFITALPTPSGYFGAEKLFGRTPDDANADEADSEPLDMIRDVPPEDEKLVQPPSAKERDGFHPQMPDSLSDAILYFLMTCAVRRAREQSDKHMTMLVHTSSYVTMHNRIADLIEAWVAKHGSEILSAGSAIFKRMADIWETEADRLPEDITTARKVDFEEMHSHLPGVLDALDVPIENGASDDRIDYGGDPKTYIVVGGTILARGLTLEGLCVSYFLRNANQYDTLLQMGRWFGYRGGYEDLPRLWMPKPLQVNFRALSSIEAEIRQDIAEYGKQPGLTPMDFAVRIRSIPGMAITARNKMRHARQCDISYSGRHVQTIRFRRTDEDLLRRNWEAGSTLIGTASSLGTRSKHDDRVLFEAVPQSAIVNFLRSYSIDDSHRDLASRMLLSFLDEQGGSMTTWNVGAMSSSVGETISQQLGGLDSLRMFRRTRLNLGPDEVADIKALMSKRDILFDCPDLETDPNRDWKKLKQDREQHLGRVPLLLLYPIDRNSSPATGKTSRLPLAASFDVLGFGIAFPGSSDLSGRYVSVELDPLSADELDERDAEDQAAVEALGDG